MLFCGALSVPRVAHGRRSIYLYHPPERAGFLLGALRLEVDTVDGPELAGNGALEVRARAHDGDGDLFDKGLAREREGLVCDEEAVRTGDVVLARGVVRLDELLVDVDLREFDAESDRKDVL